MRRQDLFANPTYFVYLSLPQVPAEARRDLYLVARPGHVARLVLLEVLTVSGAGVALGLVAALAGLIPAVRAIRTDPIIALRSE